MPEPVKCLYCGKPASKLHYYSKTYPNGKDTVESPIFTCEDCTLKAANDLSICRGGIEGTHIITFKQIGKMKEKELGWLCSKKNRAINHLSNKVLKDLIFSIHYQNLPSKKEILIDGLNWYRGLIEKNHMKDEDFDRAASGLLTCADEILKDLNGKSNA